MRYFFVVDLSNKYVEDKVDFINAFEHKFDIFQLKYGNGERHFMALYESPEKIAKFIAGAKDDFSIRIVPPEYHIRPEKTIFQAFRERYYQKRFSVFQVGKKYRRYDGVIVTILKTNDVPDPKHEIDYLSYQKNPFYPKGYECVMGDDIGSYYDPFTKVLGEGNIWRYNREGKNELGRVCGSAHDMSDPFNLYPEEVE